MSQHQPTSLPSHKMLAQLAKDDPQAFETLRNELIEKFIKSSPASIQARMRGIQFRVDGIRRISKSPLGALIKIQSMMWDSLLRMNHELQNLAWLSQDNIGHLSKLTNQTSHSVSTSQVIEFRVRPRM